MVDRGQKFNTPPYSIELLFMPFCPTDLLSTESQAIRSAAAHHPIRVGSGPDITETNTVSSNASQPTISM